MLVPSSAIGARRSFLQREAAIWALRSILQREAVLAGGEVAAEPAAEATAAAAEELPAPRTGPHVLVVSSHVHMQTHFDTQADAYAGVGAEARTVARAQAEEEATRVASPDGFTSAGDTDTDADGSPALRSLAAGAAQGTQPNAVRAPPVQVWSCQCTRRSKRAGPCESSG